MQHLTAKRRTPLTCYKHRAQESVIVAYYRIPPIVGPVDPARQPKRHPGVTRNRGDGTGSGCHCEPSQAL